MASIEAALVAVLKDDTDVAAIAGGRVFIKGGRQGVVYPYATIQRIATTAVTDLDGASSLDAVLVQIEAWDDREALQALNLADAIRAALQTGEVTGAGLTFSATLRDQRGPSADEQTRNFCVQLDFSLWHGRN